MIFLCKTSYMVQTSGKCCIIHTFIFTNGSISFTIELSEIWYDLLIQRWKKLLFLIQHYLNWIPSSEIDLFAFVIVETPNPHESLYSLFAA